MQPPMNANGQGSTVRGACPHDCPDTCALVTTVEHGVATEVSDGVQLLGCYHPSQQNMFTGRLTPAMLDDVFATATALAGLR